MSNFASSPTPDASATVKGKNKLTGDLGGTADSPTVVAITSGSASNLNSGTLPAGRLPALTGDVTSSSGSAATTLAAGSASNLNSGTLPAGRMPALTGDITTSAGAVATTIGAGKVTNAMLDTTAGVAGGAWVAWTPTVTGLTLGNGTRSAAYIQIGKIIHLRYSLTFGSTSAVTGAITCPLPVTSTTQTQYLPIGITMSFDTSASTMNPGQCRWASTTSMTIVTNDANSTFVRASDLSSTNPFTWTTGDQLMWTATYEAA